MHLSSYSEKSVFCSREHSELIVFLTMLFLPKYRTMSDILLFENNCANMQPFLFILTLLISMAPRHVAEWGTIRNMYKGKVNGLT